ncbi:Na/Pi cotransporter family protein [Wujia chipingensis]|uniref:Na/Pi cotransporter family protein n=1 Tax=Wujia chipingensis TaxID=2763670 RepID=A0A7G9FLS2_9FIRM|nr:Na/Pi cotransporter family protein [Wujia chipingensis]QNL99503.1 Na/Pi cotransporter family protein [Wujia chipingensis]
MDIFDVLSMVGGLALFLYGMHIMGDALAKMSGGKLEKVLERLTSNKWSAVLLGAGVTAVIQSSGATTVMVVGFVNSGIMKLSQAVGIIMGANIGTTATSWLLSLSGIDGGSFFLQMLKPTSFTPILAVIGAILVVFCKSEKKHNIGTILLGFAILMYGMTAMSSAVEPLKDVPQFTQILTKFENPLLGVIAGFVLTTIMQSSSVSVGILQALCSTGAVSYALALPIIMGQNIGSCTTAMISSVGASKDAKRAAAVHFYFNVIGTVVFMLVFYISNAFVHYAFLPQAANEVGIATIHSIFNIAATIVLLPLSGFLEFLAVKTIKDDDEEEDELSKHDKVLQLLDPVFLERPGFAIMQCRKVASEMAELSMKSVGRAVGLLTAYDEEIAERIRKEEDTVDKYEDQLGTYLLRLSTKDLSKEDGHRLSLMLHSLGDIERISDLAVNILLAVEQMHKKELIFSKKAMDELAVYSKALKDILTMTVNAFEQNDRYKAALVQPLEELMDDMNKELKKRHVKRLRKGKCTIELGLSLSDISDTYERISDHCSNIATCVIQVEDDELDAHEHRKEVKEQDAKWYDEQYRAYEQKYALP